MSSFSYKCLYCDTRPVVCARVTGTALCENHLEQIQRCVAEYMDPEGFWGNCEISETKAWEMVADDKDWGVKGVPSGTTDRT